MSGKSQNAPRKIVIYFKTIDNSPARRKLAGFVEYARMREWDVQTVPSNPEDIKAIIEFWKPGGCVVNAASGNNNFNGDALYGVPAVFLDRPPVALRPCDSYIYHDSSASVRLAMRELLRSGPKSCAYVSWPVPHPWDAERRKAYEEIARVNSIKPLVHKSSCGIDDPVRLQMELSAFLSSIPKPAAVLAAADPIGIQTIGAARLAGLSVPGDISVVGIDNDEELCESSNPALSSVAPDHFGAGRRAAEILDMLMDGRSGNPVKETYSNPRYTMRGSSLRLRRNDRLAVAAMEKIRTDACGGIDASAVLATFDCSRRNAEYRFRAATGLSPAEAIRKARYERAVALLGSGDIAISTVADMCGYGSLSAFSRFFKSMSGESPRAARKGRRS